MNRRTASADFQRPRELDAEDEFNGTDLTIHKIPASAERATPW